MIKIENLCKKYGDTEILKDFNLTVPKGSVYGLMGLNDGYQASRRICGA